MAFTLVKNLYGGNQAVAPPADVRMFQGQDAANGHTEIGRVMAYRGNNEDLEKCDGTKLPAVIALEKKDADNQPFRGFYILPGMVFKTRVATNTHIKEGRVNMRLDSDGDTISDADESDGTVNILKKKVVTGTVVDVWCTFGNTFITKAYDKDTVPT